MCHTYIYKKAGKSYNTASAEGCEPPVWGKEWSKAVGDGSSE